jgi:(1->4)-alpha-D-glucan 1-alpha-D-glucosylmutase
VTALRATYRLQLGPGFGFVEAAALVPYLRDLGVSHLYLSPVTQARAGSQHGYDVVDPTGISESLGGEEQLRALCTAARGAGLGIVLDVVPNHMAASEENPYWTDPARRALFFDLDPDTGAPRRFFDVSDLAGVRQEDERVFAATHATVLRLVADGLVDGFRVDHVDGLADPRGYLQHLAAAGVPHVWVEKILGPGESLRAWPVEGTTGYDFLNDVQALFVDPSGERPLTALAGEQRPFAEVASAAKFEQARTTFAPEVERLRSLFDHPDLVRAVAALPAYRTYVEPWSGRVEDADREVLGEVPASLRRVLLLDERGHDEFVTRFQQTTPAVMAKGVEDTAFYRYVRLLALNEVGGSPGRFGLTPARFHDANVARLARFPRSLLAGTTHDTKRSADVRARIGAISGIAAEWIEAVALWHALTAPLRAGGAPDFTEELLVYQTLAGAWPVDADRLWRYVEKALREAKRNTAWVGGNPEWEARVERFCRRLFEHEAFLQAFRRVAERLAVLGERAAIGQLVLRLTCPGVPDLYQGDELWDLSLVDPDNRRAVDWDRRRAILADVRAGAPPTRETVKLWTIRRLLALRAERPDAFAGTYEPLDAGPGVCAFRRADLVVMVPLCTLAPPDELAPPAALDVLEGIADALGGYRPAVYAAAGR